MSYIGKTPIVGNFQKCDAITVVNGQAAYTLQVSSANVIPESANHMLVSLNGILQAPVTSFTVSGSTLTFASNLATGDVIDFVILLGNVLDLGTPSDGTVTNAKLAQDIISAETALTSEPADTDEFLVSDAGTLKRIDYSLIKGGGITEADSWRVNTSFTGDQAPVNANWERSDGTGQGNVGTGMSESSGIFTFPSTGWWYIDFGAVTYQGGQNDRIVDVNIDATTDNSTYTNIASRGHNMISDGSGSRGSSSCSALFDVTDTANCKVSFDVYTSRDSTTVNGDSDRDMLSAKFIRLTDT